MNEDLKLLAIKALSIAAALLLAWGIVSAILLFRRSPEEARALREAAALRATNRIWEAEVDAARKERPSRERVVITNEIRVSQFTGALDALRSDYAGASNRRAALIIYNAHTN